MTSTLTDTLIRLASDPQTRFLVRNARRVRFPSSYQFRTHRHPETEINYLTSGICVMGVGSQFVTLKQGDCILIYPGQKHSFIGDIHKSSGLVQVEYQILPDSELLSRLPVFSQPAGYIKLNACQHLEIHLEQICRCCRDTASEWNELKNKYLFFQLFIELCQCCEHLLTAPTSGACHKIADLIAYINETYNQDLNIESLSRRFELSSRYVRQYFQKEMGMKCSQYITMLRLNKAKELLWHTDKSITEIALLTGFNSSQYFSKVFFSFTKMTPTNYRNTWHENLPSDDEHTNGGKTNDET